jgi:tetratricopeptide (TPR) repeat protein
MRAEALYLIDDGSGAAYADAARDAYAAAEVAGDPAVLARALYEYARSGTVCGEPSRVLTAEHRIEELIGQSRAANEPMIHYTRAFCLYFIGDIASASAEIEIVLRLIDGSDDKPMLALASNGFGVLKRAQCQFASAHEAFAKALALATKMGDDHRISVIANNLCILHTNHGDYARGIEYGEMSLRFAKRALRRTDFFPTYDSLADAYLLNGNLKKARECHEYGESLENRGRRWAEQMLYDLEYANFALVSGNTSLALELGERIERNGRGRELVVPDGGVYYKIVIYWAAHRNGDDFAWKILRSVLEKYRARHELDYLVLIGVKGWLERRMLGHISDETVVELKLFERVEMIGKRDLLRAQGFLA